MQYKITILKPQIDIPFYIEAPFAQLAAKQFAEKHKLNHLTLIQVENEIGKEVFEVNKLEMYYVRNHK